MSSLVSVRLDKSQYKKGEIVQIKISNDTDKVVHFIDDGYGLEINHQDNIVWSLDGAEVLTPLDSGESRTVEWNQHNRDNEQVPAGKYVASVKYYASEKTELLNSTKEFEIINY
jgi:hypothetical protein